MWLKNKNNLQIILVSLSFLVYLIFFLIPYANDHGFFSENIVPEGKEKLIYSLLSIPTLMLYSIYAFLNFQNITFYRSLIYPLFIINGYLGLIMCLISVGGSILWIVIFTFYVPVVLVFIGAKNGSEKDMESLNNNE